MKNTKMRLLIVLVVSMLLLLMVGALRAQDNVELTLTWWGSQNRHDRTIEVIELFEEQNPGIDITYEFSGWGDYWTRVNTQVAGGNIACVMQHDYKYMTEWAQRDLLLPLDELIESGAIDVSNISESVIDSGKVGGQTYGISLGMNSQTYILDADAFEAHGIEMPAFDWTVDDFVEISNQFADAGMWSIAYGPWDPEVIKGVFLSNGEWLFTEDDSAIAIQDPEPLFEYINHIIALMDSGAIPTMDLQADIAAPGLEGSPIVEGKEAMRYQWSNQVVALTTAAGADRNFVLYPLPRLSDGAVPNYLKPSMFFSITKNCENVEEAATFIDFFTNNLEANDILFAERGVPISSVVLGHLTEQVDETTKKVFDFIAEVGEVALPVPPPDPAGYSDIVENVYTPLFIEPVLFGMISVEEAWETYLSESNNILAQNSQ